MFKKIAVVMIEGVTLDHEGGVNISIPTIQEFVLRTTEVQLVVQKSKNEVDKEVAEVPLPTVAEVNLPNSVAALGPVTFDQMANKTYHKEVPCRNPNPTLLC